MYVVSMLVYAPYNSPFILAAGIHPSLCWEICPVYILVYLVALLPYYNYQPYLSRKEKSARTLAVLDVDG